MTPLCTPACPQALVNFITELLETCWKTGSLLLSCLQNVCCLWSKYVVSWGTGSCAMPICRHEHPAIVMP